MATLAPVLRQRYFDANGNPLAGGKLYTYLAGSGFATPKATYTTQVGDAANANPVVLDANGEAAVWFGSGYYDVRLTDAAGNVQWTALNVTTDTATLAGPQTLNSPDNTAAQVDMLTFTRGSGVGAKFKIATAGDTVNGVANVRVLFDATEVVRMTPAGVDLKTPILGNVGLGVTPSAWQPGRRALQLGRTGALYGVDTINTVVLAENIFVDAAASPRAITAGAGSQFVQSGGAFTWESAAPVAAGAGFVLTLKMALDLQGNLLLGTPSGTAHTIKKAVNTDGATVLVVTHDGAGEATRFYAVTDPAAANAGNAAIKVGRSTSTYSIRCAGVVGTSGADYAEYHFKAEGCADIAKGAVVGFTGADELTDRFADAHDFGIKSTDPAFVGADTWGDIEPPAEPGEDADDADKTAYAEALAAFDAELEARRERVDRIAYAGRVPVNVLGAAPGQYIVATHDGNGGIIGVAMWPVDMDEQDRERIVGKVRKILPDGRALVKVL